MNVTGTKQNPSNIRRRNSANISGKTKSYAELTEEKKMRVKKIVLYWLGGVWTSFTLLFHVSPILHPITSFICTGDVDTYGGWDDIAVEDTIP